MLTVGVDLAAEPEGTALARIEWRDGQAVVLDVTQGADDEDPGYRLPTDAPVIHVRGLAYKGAVEITTRPPKRPALRG